jgi:hypothetical protein
MWEIYSCGEIPYSGLANQQVIELVAKGGKLECVSEFDRDMDSNN